jgi:hypothetical protein
MIPAAPRTALQLLDVGGTAQSEIADRHDMRALVARFRMTATITECVELFDVAEVEPRLLGDPRTQAAFECAMQNRREWAERQAVDRTVRFITHDECHWFIGVNRDDRRVQANLHGRRFGAWHGSMVFRDGKPGRPLQSRVRSHLSFPLAPQH